MSLSVLSLDVIQLVPHWPAISFSILWENLYRAVRASRQGIFQLLPITKDNRFPQICFCPAAMLPGTWKQWRWLYGIGGGCFIFYSDEPKDSKTATDKRSIHIIDLLRCDGTSLSESLSPEPPPKTAPALGVRRAPGGRINTKRNFSFLSFFFLLLLFFSSLAPFLSVRLSESKRITDRKRIDRCSLAKKKTSNKQNDSSILFSRLRPLAPTPRNSITHNVVSNDDESID